MKIDSTFWVYKPILSWAARGVMIGRNRERDDPSQGRFTKNEVHGFLSAAWENYREVTPRIPKERTIGARMNVRLAALTYAMFQALLRAGVSREYAMALVADIAWKVYDRWAAIPILLSKVFPGKPSMERFLRLFLRFPFNPPGYQSRIWLEEGAVRTDFTRCPVAQFLQGLEAADLCLETWCKLDYPLAEKWGGRYSRRHTLAAGDDVCDMVWKCDSVESS